MPLVMTVISSERVRSGRKGRMVSGASVCPMKMLAATLSDSAPLAPITRVMTQAAMRMMSLHDADSDREWRKNAAMKMTVGKHLEGKDETEIGILLAELAENEIRSEEGIIEQTIGGVAGGLEHAAAEVDAQHKDGEHNLQAESPGDGFHANRATVGGESVGERPAW